MSNLSEILRDLADSAPDEVPRHLEPTLRAVFHRHHKERRRRRGLMVAALAACLAISTLITIRMLPGPAGSPAMRTAGGTASTWGNGFVPLASYDPDMPTGQLMVLRVSLPASSLNLVGLPTSGASDQDRRVVADLLVDEDGTPYAVRFAN